MNKFDGKEDMVDYLVEVLDDSEDTTIVVDYVIAKELSKLYDDEDFDDYFAIDIASDCNEYFVEKTNDNFFCIEPTKSNGVYLEGEAKRLIVLDELINDDLLDAYEYRELEIVDYKNDDIEDFKSECTCHGDCCNCYYDEHNEVKDSYFDALNREEKDFIIQELSNIKGDIDFEFIAKVYLTGFNNGVEDGLLSIKEAIDNALDEE